MSKQERREGLWQRHRHVMSVVVVKTEKNCILSSSACINRCRQHLLKSNYLSDEISERRRRCNFMKLLILLNELKLKLNSRYLAGRREQRKLLIQLSEMCPHKVIARYQKELKFVALSLNALIQKALWTFASFVEYLISKPKLNIRKQREVHSWGSANSPFGCRLDQWAEK